MTYRQRLSILTVIDYLSLLTAMFIGIILLNKKPPSITLVFVVSMMILVGSYQVLSFRYKLYRKAWEYASIGELIIILKTVSFSIIFTLLIQEIVFQDVYLRLLIIVWMLNMFLIGGSRFIWRVFRDADKRTDNKKRTLIIGAGAAGTMVVRQLLKSHETELLPVAFIDDNIKKQNLDIFGVPVVGGVKQIETTVQKLHIENIVIAIPSLRKRELNTIFQECVKTKARTQIMPMLEDIVMGKVAVSQFRDVQVEDLLGREPVELDIESVSQYITDKVVLVTGAGGSIGSEICRQVSKFNPRRLILLGHGENSIYSTEMELKDLYKESKVEFITEIADLQDSKKMMTVIKTYKPDVVYHAAAHKHVPLMERNPEEAVKNNIIGTMNVARAASWNSVGTFVMISTDKAVNPTSVMGATKRLAEMIIQNMDKHSSTKFVAVRFGNVLGSRGSVIPRFKQQIEQGGPVTVTHPEMVRYFMTIPEASRLVIQAGALAKGGEIFILDMGEPVKIVDLAKNLIQLSGNTVEEIGIEFTGVRPGEKLFEELLKKDEVNEQQVYPKIYIGKTSELHIDEIEDIMTNFSSLDKEKLRERLIQLANIQVISQPSLISISV